VADGIPGDAVLCEEDNGLLDCAVRDTHAADIGAPAGRALWVTLFLPGLAIAVALPACASMLSLMVSADEPGSVLGNNQSIVVGAEALSGFAAGLLAALAIELPLIALAGVAVFAAVLLAAEGERRHIV
jgi:hypothetical protein